MKRRILGLLLALCMVLSLLPPTALATEETTTEETPATEAVTITFMGTAYEVAATKTTYYSVTGGSKSANSTVTDITAEVEGGTVTDWNIKLDNRYEVAELTIQNTTLYAYTEKAMTVEGKGALKITVTGESSSLIWANASNPLVLSMEGGTTITSVDNQLLEVQCNSSSTYDTIYSDYALRLENANIYAWKRMDNRNGQPHGTIYVKSDLYITNSTVDVVATLKNASGIYVVGKLTITNNSVVTVDKSSNNTAENQIGHIFGVYAEDGIVFGGGKLEIKDNSEYSRDTTYTAQRNYAGYVEDKKSYSIILMEMPDITTLVAEGDSVVALCSNNYDGTEPAELKADDSKIREYRYVSFTYVCGENNHTYSDPGDAFCNKCGLETREVPEPVTIALCTASNSSTPLTVVSQTVGAGEVYYAVASYGMVTEFVTEKPEKWTLMLDNRDITAKLIFSSEAYLACQKAASGSASAIIGIAGDGALQIINQGDATVQVHNTWTNVISTQMGGGTTYSSESGQLKLKLDGNTTLAGIIESVGKLTLKDANIQITHNGNYNKQTTMYGIKGSAVEINGGELEVTTTGTASGLCATESLTLNNYAKVSIKYPSKNGKDAYYGVEADTINIDQATLIIQDDAGYTKGALKAMPDVQGATASYKATADGELKALDADAIGKVIPYIEILAICDVDHDAIEQEDCTVAVTCATCKNEVFAAQEAHVADEDDGDCTTAVKCANCDQIVTEGNADHTYSYADNGNGTHAVTCTNDGCEYSANENCVDEDADSICDKCSATLTCKHTDTEVIPGYAATCTAPGLTDGEKCSKCGETTVEQVEIPVDENAHTNLEQEVAKAPTCSKDGYKAYEHCDACGYTTYEKDPATNVHSYTVFVETVAPDFGKQGYTVYKCATCELTENQNYTDALVAIAENVATGKQYETLTEAIAAGGEIMLLDNLTVEGLVTIDKAITLDLNGKTITRAGSAAGAAALYVTAEGAVIKNGAVTLTGNGIAIWVAADVEIDNVTVTGADVGIYVPSANSATVTVKNSTVVATRETGPVEESGDGIRAYGESVVNIVNSTITGSVSGSAVEVYGTASVTVDADSTINTNGDNYSAIVYGGTLTVDGKAGAICISDDAPEGVAAATVKGTDLNVTTTIADSKVVCNDGVYTVVAKDYVAQVGDTKYESLAEAIAAATEGDTVTLIGTVELTEAGVEFNKTLTLNLNGQTVTSVGDAIVVTAGTLTIEGEGNVIAATDNAGSSCAVWANGGKVVIKNGTYTTGGDTTTTDVAHQNDSIYTKNGGSVEIYGGTFKYTEGVWTLNENDANRGTIKVYGGEFEKFDPANNNAEGANTNFLADTTKHTMVENDIYTICTCAAKDAVQENASAASCTVPGTYESVVYCECGKELSRETVTGETLPHDYEEVVTEPTCTEGGYTTYTCPVCGDSYVDDEVAATGHTFNQQVKNIKYRKSAATANAPAIFYVSCACGESSEGYAEEATWNYGEALGGVAMVDGVYYTTLAEALTEAQKTGATVVLQKNFTTGAALEIASDVTIDFNGFYYTANVATDGAAMIIAEGAKVTLKGGKLQIRYTNGADFSYLIVNNGTLTTENITLSGNNALAEGETYTIVNNGALTLGEGTVVTVKANGLKATANVTKAETVALVAPNGYHWANETALEAHSYETTNVPATFTEVSYDLHECACGDSYKDNYGSMKLSAMAKNMTTGELYGSVNEAIAEASEGDTIKLTKKVNSGAAIVITKNVTIDFGGFVYTVGEAESGAAVVVAEGVEATLTNGTVQIRYTSRNDFNCLVNNNGTLNVDNTLTLKATNAYAADAEAVKGNAVSGDATIIAP